MMVFYTVYYCTSGCVIHLYQDYLHWLKNTKCLSDNTFEKQTPNHETIVTQVIMVSDTVYYRTSGCVVNLTIGTTYTH
jgi:hypothetical protein